MRAVRWIGAFGRGPSALEAARFEVAQPARLVCAEPLAHDTSRIRAKIGLEVDVRRSVLHGAWLRDACTVDGRPGKRHSRASLGREYRDWDRYAAACARSHPDRHAEAVFAGVVYRAVVVAEGASPRVVAMAQEIATDLGLPVTRARKKGERYS